LVTERATVTFAAGGQDVSLSLHHRPYATAQDDWDRDVLTATIAAKTGDFRGGVATVLWARQRAVVDRRDATEPLGQAAGLEQHRHVTASGSSARGPPAAWAPFDERRSATMSVSDGRMPRGSSSMTTRKMAAYATR
jgi:hypothetical protein